MYFMFFLTLDYDCVGMEASGMHESTQHRALFGSGTHGAGIENKIRPGAQRRQQGQWSGA